MQTLLDGSGVAAPDLVRLAAGLPGGIGNTGAECGGITGSLLMVGFRHAHHPTFDGLPRAVYVGHDIVQHFQECKGTNFCREIRGDARVPLRCIGVVRDAPAMCVRALSCNCADAIPADRREPYRRLHAHFQENGFHCAHAVLDQLRGCVSVRPELLDATSLFVGGTLFMGMTCSALTAGVMALGAALGRIENSRLRVGRMIGLMALGGDAFADDVNEFNRIMNLGHRLADWFSGEFGSTECHAIANSDFSTVAGVGRYIESGVVTRCRTIADRVAGKVRQLIDGPALVRQTGGP